MDDDELERLRAADRDRDDDESRAREGGDAGGTAVLAVTTTAGNYPTAPAAFFMMQAVTVTGPETEGGAPTFETYGAPFAALNLGTAVPAQGTRTVVDHVEERWTFRYD